MSYPSLSNYYASSSQQSQPTNNAYPSHATSGNYAYPKPMNSSSNAQSSQYGTSGYTYTGQHTYSNQSSVEQGGEAYAAGSAYEYQGSNNYEDQDSSLNDAYSQNYYGRSNGAHTQSQSRNEGLTSLAYASAFNSSDSTTNASQKPQRYDGNSHPAAQQHNRVRSSGNTQSGHLTNTRNTSTSHPMQQQGSASSTSSNQLAVNAAAALAGAVSRRYPNQQNGKSINAVEVSHQRQQSTSTSALQSPSELKQRQYRPGNSYSVPDNQTRKPQAPTSSRNSAQHTSSAPSQSVSHPQPSSTPARSIQQTSRIANLISTAQETAPQNSYVHATEVQETAPTFIDPTAVFDPYHREREQKRLEAAAQARKKAEEDARLEEARKQREKIAEQAQQLRQQEDADAQKRQRTTKSTPSSAKKSTQRSTVPPPPSSMPPAASSVAAATSEEETMAAEIKSMMEKMKAFQSKDPSLFKKLWNEMKQPNPSQNANTVQSPSPQIAQRTIPASTSPKAPAEAQAIPVSNTTSQVAGNSADQNTAARRKLAQIGPDGNRLHLNGYPVIVENNPEGLPDMGRFPAERRIRPPKYNSRKDKSADVATEPGTRTGAASSASPQTASPRSKSLASILGPASTTNDQSAANAMTTSGPPVGALNTPTMSTISNNTFGQKSSSGTVWPLERRNALTATALKALKANPENAALPLTEDDLHKILESNPSYMTLCENLEQRGFKFHRGQFARELLNSVPELKTPSATQNATPTPVSTPATPIAPAQPVPAAVTAPTAPHNVPVPSVPVPYGFQPHGFPPPQPPPGYMVRYHDPNIPHAVPVPSSTQYGHGMGIPLRHGLPPPPSVLRPPYSKVVPARPEPPFGSKEAAARKRDFSELIDLTELGDDENYVAPDKHPRLEGTDSDVEMEENPIRAFQKQVQGLLPHNTAKPTTRASTPTGQISHSNNQRPLAPQPLNTSTKRSETAADTKGQRVILAKTLNKSEALKKQYYDPKTVARDILIASGRHPSERPLNVHLAGMLGKYIDLDSDVSTFEWNEIDPGGPPIPKVDLVDIPATKPRFKIGDRVPKRDKPRSSIIDKTRQPEKEKRHKTIAPAPQSKPSTIPSPSSQAQPAKFKKPSGLRQSLLASDENATPATLDPTLPPRIVSDRSSPLQTVSVGKEKPAMEERVKRKAGRPPGSKNKYPTLGGLRVQASEAVGVRINVPPREPTPGRERFKCKWKKCSTVLHNLDTLRKHIGRLHCPSSEEIAKEGYTCWWKKCKFLKQEENGDWITTKVFEHREEWLRHIEKEHVSPIAMKYGDGPSTAHVDPLIIEIDRVAYCADENKHEVTPIINDHHHGNEHYPSDVLNLTEVPPSDMTAHAMTDKQKSEKAAHLAYLKAHDLSKDTRAASREVIRAMEKRKEKIGPGIDRGGCTLINQEMREIFVQNPRIRKIVALNE